MRECQKNKKQEPIQKLGVYVDVSLPNYCSWCGKEITRVELSANGNNSIQTEMAVCKICKKAFTTTPFFLKQQDRLYSLNPEKTEQLTNQIIEQKRKKEQEEKNKIKASKKEKRKAIENSIELKKNELLDKMNQQLIGINSIDVNSFKSEWINMKIDVQTLNSIMAIYVVKEHTGNYSCILVSSRDEISKIRVIAGKWIKLVSWKDVRGRILLSSGKYDFNYYFYADKKYDIAKEIIISPGPYGKRINRIGNIYADRWKDDKNESITALNNYQNTNTRVHVYFSLTNTCLRKGHAIENVTAKTTNVKNNHLTEVNVFHCQVCRKYYINYEALRKYIARGIYPALHYSFNRVDDGMLKDASELMLYGYNVREGNLSLYERRRILEWIIDSGLLTKAEIIRDLQFKVKYNGSKPGNERARQKWIDDIQFVSQYTRNNSRKINAAFIYKNKLQIPEKRHADSSRTACRSASNCTKCS